MSPKSSLPQPTNSVSLVLMSDRRPHPRARASSGEVIACSLTQRLAELPKKSGAKVILIAQYDPFVWGAKLSANLIDADLSAADRSAADLSNANLSAADLSGVHLS